MGRAATSDESGVQNAIGSFAHSQKAATMTVFGACSALRPTHAIPRVFSSMGNCIVESPTLFPARGIWQCAGSRAGPRLNGCLIRVLQFLEC